MRSHRDLAAVRNETALERLAIEERNSWQAFWSEVTNLWEKGAEVP